MNIKNLLANQEAGFISLQNALAKMTAQYGASYQQTATILHRLLSEEHEHPQWKTINQLDGIKAADDRVVRFALEYIKNTALHGEIGPEYTPASFPKFGFIEPEFMAWIDAYIVKPDAAQKVELATDTTPTDKVELVTDTSQKSDAKPWLIQNQNGAATKVEAKPVTASNNSKVYWRVVLKNNIKTFDAASKNGKATVREVIKSFQALNDVKIPCHKNADTLVWIDDMGSRQTAAKKTISNAMSEARKQQ